jgi:hypothetical protein
VAPVDNLANCLFFELSCVFGSLHLHFSHSDFDNNICLLNWGNAKQLKANLPNFTSVSFEKNDTAVAQMVKFSVGLFGTL